MILKNISEAKSQLSALVESVLSGEEVIIGKAGKPLVLMTVYSEKKKKRCPGALRGKIKMADDFDELPPDIADAFGLSAS